MKDDAILRTELVISEILRWGVRISLAVILAGIAISLAALIRGGNSPAELHAMLASGATFPRTFGWFFDGLARLDGTAVTVAGLALLILTPIVRVAASVVAFAIQRDRAYVAITGFVFAVIVLSILMGKV